MPDSVSKYRIIEQGIVDTIQKGNYHAHDRIESENELCRRYGASRITVRKALDELCSRNVLYRKQGAGTFVSDDGSASSRKDKKKIFVITPYVSRLMSNVARIYLPEIYAQIDPDYYSVHTVMEPVSKEYEEDFIASIQKQNAAGIIYYYFDRKSVLEKLRALGIPVVLVDIEPEGNAFDLVTGEDFESASRAASALIRSGCRKIGFFSQFARGMSTSDLRESGIRQTLSENQIPVEERFFFHGPDRGQLDGGAPEALMEKAERYLCENRDLDAVITANDDSAFILLGAAGGLKIRIPENLKVISYGNYSLCSLPLINLTSYEQNLGKYAAEAAKLLAMRIEGKLPPVQQRRTIRYRLIRRGTFL